MDLVQLLIVDLGWFFLAAWATVLAAVTVIAFGRDIRALSKQFGETSVEQPAKR